MKQLRILVTMVLTAGISILVSAQHTTATKTNAAKKPTVVFVHGLWADGSSWSKVIERLQAQGYNTVAVQNPTTSLEDDVNATQRALDRIDGDVVLVAHSWGGFVISQAGNNPKVKSLVYVAALMPDEGETLPSLSANAPATKLNSYFDSKDGFIKLSREGVMKAFANNLPVAEQNVIYATQTPASEKVFSGVSGAPAWKQKPSYCIVAKKDGAINPDLERYMAKRSNAKTTELNASHVSMVSQPQAVTNVVLQAARSIKE